MMKDARWNMVIWILVVIVFIGALIYVSRNKPGNMPENEALGQTEQNTNDINNINNTNMENTQQANGVKTTVLKEGTGAIAKKGDLVSMNYTGALVDGTVFDSNVDPKFQHVEPFVFNLGAGQVIRGWDEGIVGMKVGEKRKLEITPDYAYGATGAGGVIPPNATLYFEVELVAIKS